MQMLKLWSLRALGVSQGGICGLPQASVSVAMCCVAVRPGLGLLFLFLQARTSAWLVSKVPENCLPEVP